MPYHILKNYDLSCNNCNYEWTTKYPKIPASCPSCNTKIHNTSNYMVEGENYSSYPTEEEQFNDNLFTWRCVYIIFLSFPIIMFLFLISESFIMAVVSFILIEVVIEKIVRYIHNAT